jgi:hypothetical protein
MEETSENTHLNERKTSLQAIKEYLLSLFKKTPPHPIKQEIEDTLTSKNKAELEKKQESFLEKMKKKLFEKNEPTEEKNN